MLDAESSQLPAAADPAADADHHRAKRTRRLAMAIVSSALVKPLAAVTPVIVIPLFVRYLGSERYGLYESIAAIAVWMGTMNLGLGIGLMNRLAGCYVSGDKLLAQRYVSTMVVTLATLALAVVALTSLVTPLVNWGAIFPTTTAAVAAEVPWAVWVAGLAAMVGIVAGVVPVVYSAYQEIHRSNIWDMAARLLTLGACVAVTRTSLGISGVILAMAGVSMLVWVTGGAWMLGHAKPWLRPRVSLFDWSLLRPTLAEGLCFFVLLLAGATMFQADRIIIGVVRGPEEVTSYAIVGRVFLMGYGLFSLLLTPLWPAYGEAVRRRDLAWVRRSLRLSTCIALVAALAAGAAMVLFGDRIMSLLSGGRVAAASPWLVVGLAVGIGLRMWGDCHSVILNASSVVVPQMVSLVANALVAAGLAIGAAHWQGATGVAWAYPIAATLTSVWAYPWMVRRYVLKPLST